MNNFDNYNPNMNYLMFVTAVVGALSKFSRLFGPFFTMLKRLSGFLFVFTLLIVNNLLMFSRVC